MSASRCVTLLAAVALLCLQLPSPLAAQQSPTISLSATSLTFDSTTVGATSQKTLTISDTSSVSLSITGITVTGPDSSQFKVSPTTATVAAKGSQTITVTFAPTSAGAKTASLSIAHNATGSPSTVALSGKGTQPPSQAPAISLSATSLTFDSTEVGKTSQKTLTIKNTGSGSLVVTGITVTGADTSHFKVSPTRDTVAAGGSKTITVTFAPTSAGKKSAALSIAHNATGSPSTVTLSGTGVQAATQPPAAGEVPEPARQDTTKMGVWLDLNTAAGNQYVASGSAGPGTEVTIQVFGRNLTPATNYGVILTYDTTAVAFVADKFKPGDYLPGGISLAPQAKGGSVEFGAALLGGSPVSGNGLLGTAVFKTSDKFTAGFTILTVKELKLGGRSQTIQTSNAIIRSLANAPPVAKFTIKPEAIRAGDTKAVVMLDASGSSDPDADPITFKWSVPGATFKKSTSDTSRVAQVVFAETTKSNVSITLTATDKNGLKTAITHILKVIAPPPDTALVAVDLDKADGNQNLGLRYGVAPGDTITLQVFVKDVSGVTGYTVKVSYDTMLIGSPAFTNGSLVTVGTFIPLTKIGGGVVEGGGTTLPLTPNAGSGLLAKFTFKVKDGFAGGTVVSVTSVNLQIGTQKRELLTAGIDVVLSADKPGTAGPASDFSGDGEVGFDDFFAFALAFDTKKGDPGFNPIFDLNGDGKVDFDDFFLFAGEFGLKSEKPAVRQ